MWHEYYGYNKQNNLYASNLFRCAILESAVQDKWFILSSTTNTSFDEKQEISNQNTIIYAGPSKLTIIHKQYSLSSTLFLFSLEKVTKWLMICKNIK